MLVQQIRGEKKEFSYLSEMECHCVCQQLGSMVWQQRNVLEHSTVESLKAFFEGSVHKTYPESLFNSSALRQQLLGCFFFRFFITLLQYRHLKIGSV